MSRLMSSLVTLSNCQKSIFQVQGSLRVGPTLAVEAEPGRADLARPSPCPAQPVIFQVTGPRPTRFVRFRSHTPSARPGQRDSSLTGCLPGLAREILRIFFALAPLCVSSSSMLRGRKVLVSPRPAVSLRQPLAVHKRHTKQSLTYPYTGLQITVGAAWVT